MYVKRNINPLTPNDPNNGHTAPLTSKRCILYIYSTNTGTEYFKNGIYSPFASEHKGICWKSTVCIAGASKHTGICWKPTIFITGASGHTGICWKPAVSITGASEHTGYRDMLEAHGIYHWSQWTYRDMLEAYGMYHWSQ